MAGKSANQTGIRGISDSPTEMQFSKTFTCYKCLRAGDIVADSPEGLLRIAAAIGWRQATPTPEHPEARVICHRCPAGNAKGNLTMAQAEQMEREYQRALQSADFRAELAATDS